MTLDPAIHQSLAFLALITTGLFLKTRISQASELLGIKTIILCVALPATIFVALLKVKLTGTLLFLPLLGLLGNLIVFCLGFFLIVPIFLHREKPEIKRTYALLIPSFAPGLSCFPFIAEYLGSEALASAAMVDVGNKIFVLLILYLLAMHWYYQTQSSKSTGKPDVLFRMKRLLLNLVREPVNSVIILAIVLLGIGANFSTLPEFIQNYASKAHAMTTGLILLYIGLALKLNWQNAKSILSILFLRSGLAFVASAGIIATIGSGLSDIMQMLIIILPQGSCSFWPVAHITAVDAVEKNESRNVKTFDLQSALNLVAFSLTFSSLIILALCSYGSLVAQPSLLLLIGMVGIVAALVMRFLNIRSTDNREMSPWVYMRDLLL